MAEDKFQIEGAAVCALSYRDRRLLGVVNLISNPAAWLMDESI